MTTQEHNRDMEGVRQQIHRRYGFDYIRNCPLHHLTPNPPVRGFIAESDRESSDLEKGLKHAKEKGSPLIVPFNVHGRDYNFLVYGKKNTDKAACYLYAYVFNLLDAQGHRV